MQPLGEPVLHPVVVDLGALLVLLELPQGSLLRRIVGVGVCVIRFSLAEAVGPARRLIRFSPSCWPRTVETGTYPRFRTAETYAQRPSAGEIDLPVVPLAEAAE